MFLKRRNVIAWGLLIVAAVCWIYGRAELRNDGADIVETSQAAATTYPVLEFSTAATGPQRADEGRDEAPAQEGNRFVGYVLCIISAATAILGIIVWGQKSPILGPDIVLGICAIYVWVWNTFVNGYGIPLAVFYSDYAQIVLLFGLLATVRDLWGWIRTGASLEWCLVYRLAKLSSSPQMAMMSFLAWPVAGVIGIALIIDGGVWLSVLLLAALGFFGFAGLWRYGRDIRHFQQQLDNFQQDKEIIVSEGAFSETEKQLQLVQKQHAQAIQSAVTSERFKVELIANVSHDLRTPLTSILGYSELLQKEELSLQGKEQLERLHRKAGYMRDLVESLFELTKVSSGVLECEKREIDLIRLLEQTIGLFDDQLAVSGLTIRRSYEKEAVCISTDGARMHQVFDNLLGNAIKYALPGTRIHIEVRQKEETWAVRIVNTASYIMDFQEEEILQRFARGDKARSTQGNGLGLAIAKTYTESVGGGFSVQVDGDQFNAIVELPKL